MKNQVLFRASRNEQEEMDICSKHFDTASSRVGLSNSLIIARYSALPFYKELEEDLKLQGSKLINSYFEHNFIASFDWYNKIRRYTPKSYFSLEELPKEGGPFVLKGRTNSRKHQWATKMFAKDVQDARRIYHELINDDALISQQGIVIRDYVPLEDFGTSINGQPFANEWRCFFYKDTLLSYGYYWVSGDIIPDKSVLAADPKAMKLLKNVANTIKNYCNFYVVDIAKTKDGKWIVIELNDGQMSGLSDNDPETLYSNLKKTLENEKKA